MKSLVYKAILISLISLVLQVRLTFPTCLLSMSWFHLHLICSHTVVNHSPVL